MAQITLQIPDNVLPRVVEALADTYGWSAAMGVTRAQFARQVIIRFVRDVVTAHEAGRDAETARAAAVVKADAEVTIS